MRGGLPSGFTTRTGAKGPGEHGGSHCPDGVVTGRVPRSLAGEPDKEDETMKKFLALPLAALLLLALSLPGMAAGEQENLTAPDQQAQIPVTGKKTKSLSGMAFTCPLQRRDLEPYYNTGKSTAGAWIPIRGPWRPTHPLHQPSAPSYTLLVTMVGELDRSVTEAVPFGEHCGGRVSLRAGVSNHPPFAYRKKHKGNGHTHRNLWHPRAFPWKVRGCSLPLFSHAGETFLQSLLKHLAQTRCRKFKKTATIFGLWREMQI